MGAEHSTDRTSWAIGGCTLIGLGAGLIFLETSILWFVAALLIGIGIGLLIVGVLSALKKPQ